MTAMQESKQSELYTIHESPECAAKYYPWAKSKKSDLTS